MNTTDTYQKLLLLAFILIALWIGSLLIPRFQKFNQRNADSVRKVRVWNV